MKRTNLIEKTDQRKFWDYLFTLPVLILLSPLFLIIAIWIKLDSPGPVLFRQKRVGIYKKHFEILKFRTMRTDTPKDIPTHLLKNPEQYITPSGRFLRKTSLDELPQLLNILRGEMSIVGPRPALWNQYDLIRERDRYGANDVLPGLTGWAQIHGRDELPIKEKAALDGYYVLHQGFLMDMKCILLTIGSVLRQEGVREGGTGVMCEGADLEQNRQEVPLVTVVVATYRREKELRRALFSLVQQSYKNLEVVLVDDNADEEWNQKVERLVSVWKKKNQIPLTYIQNAENLGSAASRNLGIAAAQGAYITFLDDDDWYKPEKIRHQVVHMVKQKADYAISNLALYNESGKLEEKRIRSYLNPGKKYETEELLALHLMYHLTGTDTLMFRRAYLEQIGGFPPIDVGDEFYLMAEAIQAGGVFTYLPLCEVKALVHSSTQGLSSREGKIAGENALYTYKQQFFEKLKASEVRKIKMRHHLVLAYAYMRDKKMQMFLREGLWAVGSAPLACARMILEQKLLHR